MPKLAEMATVNGFLRRGIVEGFFGPPWSMSHRASLLEFGSARGMNSYLYAPKDDPYHREKWAEPYPEKEWKDLVDLIRIARSWNIDFIYGFHPGKGLSFSATKPITVLLEKARRFYDVGVRTFAVLFDDIPSRLERVEDRRRFEGSLARAEGFWLGRIFESQPSNWKNVEWWICPSYYTEDSLLSRTFGAFEPRFLEKLSAELPEAVACMWTGPKIVPERITLPHVRKIARRIQRRLVLWDNYPVNDLAMSEEMHLGPLRGRDPRLPELMYGYLNNPLLQESLSFIPLATCFDYASNPSGYVAEESWCRIVCERFGSAASPHWRTLRRFCDSLTAANKKGAKIDLPKSADARLRKAYQYCQAHGSESWARELRPWLKSLQNALQA